MKKLLAILLAAMMLLSLAACGNNDDNPSGSENNPGTSQSDNQGGTENQGGESTNNGGGDEVVVDVDLLDLADADIIAIKNGKTVLEGDEAAEVIAHIPAEIKKYVGELDADDCKVLANKDYTLFDFKMKFRVPNASVKSYYDAVTEYYKSLGGTVTKEETNGDWHDLGMTFDWGELRGCNYTLGYYENDYAAISVEFYINAE